MLNNSSKYLTVIVQLALLCLLLIDIRKRNIHTYMQNASIKGMQCPRNFVIYITIYVCFHEGNISKQHVRTYDMFVVH